MAWPWTVACVVACVLATLTLYAGDLPLGFFQVDDARYVVDDPWIRGITMANLRHVLGAPYFANYSPVHLLSYMVDYALAGPSAVGFHLSSNLWAGAVAALVFAVALALTGSRTVALAAAALFVVHPVHVEAIAWISSRKDLVAVAFALPSLLAYLRYRRSGGRASGWYVASLLLFLLAVGAKLSVAGFPALLLAFDVFVEGRPVARSLADKMPYVLATAGVALVVASAQPTTGLHPDPYVLFASLGESLWLLSGFGRYVLYRTPPEPGGLALELVGAAALVAILGAPLLLRRRFPLLVVLVYWILFTWLPTQVLSFTYPVADRYLFLPSVAATILLAWGVIAGGRRLGRRGSAAAAVALVAIAGMWTWTTLAYLAEWRDPRSVWYGAMAKSSDPQVYSNLALRYLDVAARLSESAATGGLRPAEASAFASHVWAGDERLPALLSEWGAGQRAGPVEREFQEHLRSVAWVALDRALVAKGGRIMPELSFHRGLILLDRGRLHEARAEFLAAVEEIARARYPVGSEEVLVDSHDNLGIVAWAEGDHREALRWFRVAEEEQARLGGNWVPDVTANRKRLEAIVASDDARGEDVP